MKPRRRLWTADEDAALAREIVAGKSATEIAEKIGRTPSAVQSRVTVLGMTFRKMRLKKSRKE